MDNINLFEEKKKKSLDDYIKDLPPLIGKEIFKFIIPNSELIKYKNFTELNKIFCGSKYSTEYYGNKYEVAFLNNEQVVNKKFNKYLSRIYKKNGKHRYYITYIKSVCGSCLKNFRDCSCRCTCVLTTYCDNYYEYYKCRKNCNCREKNDYICNFCEVGEADIFYSEFIGKDIDKALVELLL
jgi:hypothetical protein